MCVLDGWYGARRWPEGDLSGAVRASMSSCPATLSAHRRDVGGHESTARSHTRCRPTASASAWRYVTTLQFWFESRQNWQSEFIAVAAIVGLSIFLRQRGSVESKPVAEPHGHTSA